MRTRRKRLYVAAESGGYGVDPDTDGSDYTYVPAIEIGELKDGKEQLATDYYTGRAHGRTAPILGRDGWSFDVTLPFWGLSGAAGDGVNTSSIADDVLDIFLDHIFGAGTDTLGEGVAAGSGANTLVIDTLQVTHLNQNVIAVWEAGLPTSTTVRSQLATITANGASTTLSTAPAWATNPTAAAVLQGGRWWTPADAGGGPTSLSFVYDMDGTYYLLAGGRITSWSLKMASPGQIWKLSMSIAGDAKTENTSAKNLLDLPLAVTTPPLKGLLSPIWFGTTQYAVSSIEISGGLEAAEVGSSAAINGRANYEAIAQSPTIKITPLYTDAIANLKRNATKGRVLVQMGSGAGDATPATVINCAAFAAEEAHVSVADVVDDSGMVRQSVELRVSDAVNFDSSTPSRIFQVVRF